jgi:hypothetical protein
VHLQGKEKEGSLVDQKEQWLLALGYSARRFIS